MATPIAEGVGVNAKRPRTEAPDEHSWLADECLICKEATAPFPVLSPECHHPYCESCARAKMYKKCDLCRRAWAQTAITVNLSNGLVILISIGGFIDARTNAVLSTADGVPTYTTVGRIMKFGAKRARAEAASAIADAFPDIRRDVHKSRTEKHVQKLTRFVCAPLRCDVGNGDTVLLCVEGNRMRDTRHAQCNVVYIPVTGRAVKCTVRNGRISRFRGYMKISLAQIDAVRAAMQSNGIT